jgi:hypothetical protein
MNNLSLHSTTRAWLVSAGIALFLPATANAADWTIPHSWRWPLYTRVDSAGQTQTGEPRPAIWNSSGELQKFNGGYLHPGVDIRGDHGDPVIMPTGGTIERVFLWDDDCLNSGTSCRVWFKTDDNRYLYYVSHIDLAPVPVADPPGRRQVTTELREKFQNAVNGSGDRSFTVGQRMANLTMFGGTANGWHHLHLGIFDRQAGYVMVPTTDFLEQQPTGQTGISKLILDDEPPVIDSLNIVTDQTQNNAVGSGVCGDEVWGQLDLVAAIRDTFFTSGTFATFPGLGTLPPSTGIRSARYLVRSLATTEIVAEGTWFDLIQTPIVCPVPVPANRSCVPAGPIDDTIFLNRMALEAGATGAPSPGLSILNKLFDFAGSTSDYSVANGELYRHIVTNTNGTEAAWNAASLPNGRYQVSVEAADFNGNKGALTRFVTVRNPATTLDPTAPGFADVFVKDRDTDTGAVPSNLGGQPFWESPDIILVPVNTIATVDTVATQTVVAAGVKVWAYLRVNNNGCSPISNVKARLFSADPTAITTTWKSITQGTDYVGDADAPDGETVPAGGRAILGPFEWTPSAEDAQFGGHRCLLGAASAPNDTVPAGAELDAPNRNNVGQRNLQVGNCQFQLPNPTATASALGMTLRTDARVDQGEIVDIFLDFDPAWQAAWSAVPGIAVSQQGNKLRLRMLAASVVLPDVTFAGNALQNLSFALTLPNGTPTRNVSLETRLNGATNGVSCSDKGGSIVG